jgi:hypothetical protein
MRRDMFDRNPLATHEIRAYKHSMPQWMQTVDKWGVILATLTICAFLVLYWIYDRALVPPGDIYPSLRFSVSAYLQIAIGSVYICVLLRCLVAGMGTAARSKRNIQEDVSLSGISAHKIIIGQWYAGLYQARAWMVALGLIRIAATLVLTADYHLNVANIYADRPYGLHPLQLPLAFSFAVLLTFFDVWATVGIGILAGNWIQNRMLSSVAAIILRILPMLFFSWFPTTEASSGGYYNLLVVRWYEYSWFAFVDGGNGAFLRLTLPTYGSYLEMSWFLGRSLWPFLLAFHMFLFYGLGSYLLTRLCLRKFGTNSVNNQPPHFLNEPASLRASRYENICLGSGAIIFSLIMIVVWSYMRRATPSLGGTMYYNPEFFNWVQFILWVAIGFTTLRAIGAGIKSARIYKDQLLESHLSVRIIIKLAVVTCHQLRGWFLGLVVVFMTIFGLLITEYLVNFYHAQLYDCILLGYDRGICGYTYFGWHPAQWVLGLTMTIILSGTILLSGVVMGISLGTTFRSSIRAFIASSIIRLLPVLVGFLSPNVLIPDYIYGFMVARWQQDPVMIFIDGGISTLLGMAEPFWHTGHMGGYTTLSFGLLSFTLVIYMLLGYAFFSLALARYWHRRGYVTGQKAKNGAA